MGFPDEPPVEAIRVFALVKSQVILPQDSREKVFVSKAMLTPRFGDSLWR